MSDSRSDVKLQIKTEYCVNVSSENNHLNLMHIFKNYYHLMNVRHFITYNKRKTILYRNLRVHARENHKIIDKRT